MNFQGPFPAGRLALRPLGLRIDKIARFGAQRLPIPLESRV
jgi:hypothetical protein